MEAAPKKRKSTRENQRRVSKKRKKAKIRRRILKCLAAAVLCYFLLAVGLQGAGKFINRMYGLAQEQQIQKMKGKLAESEDGEFPESLLELLEKNPEARDFVLNYEENKDKEWERDVADEVTEGEIPLFIQWDERWGYDTYGGDFLAVTGCGPTCLSMVICGVTGETKWNPYEVAQWAEEEGYYVEGTGSAWDLMVSGAEHFGLVSEEVIFDETHIRAVLESDIPIVCAMRPGDFTTGGHFLVLTGIDREGNIRLNDPNSPQKSEQSWKLGDLMPQIKNLWALSKG